MIWLLLLRGVWCANLNLQPWNGEASLLNILISMLARIYGSFLMIPLPAALKPSPWNARASVLPLCFDCWAATYGSLSWFHSFLLPAVVSKLKPSALEWWGKCSNTLISMLACTSGYFSWFYSFCCQRQCLNSNLQPWNYSITVLPMLVCNLWIFSHGLTHSVASGSV